MTIERYRVRQTSWGTQVRVLLAQLFGVGTEGQDASAEPIASAEVIQPHGFISRPLITASNNLTTAFVLQIGDEHFVLHTRDKSQPVLADADVAAGDTVVHSTGSPSTVFKFASNGDAKLVVKSGQVFSITVNNAVISIDANGKVSITSASGQDMDVHAQGAGNVNVTSDSGNIVLNSGTADVARVGDAISAGQIAVAFSPGSGGASLSLTYTDAAGTPHPAITTTGTIDMTTGKVTAGAPNVKA